MLSYYSLINAEVIKKNQLQYTSRISAKYIQRAKLLSLTKHTSNKQRTDAP